MLDLTDIERIGKQTIKMASGEGLRPLDRAVLKNPMLGLDIELVRLSLEGPDTPELQI